MPLQLTLIAHAPTAATRASSFPNDDPLDPPLAALANPIRRVDRAWTSPAQAARQTATALGLTATPDPALRDLDLGTWAGRPSTTSPDPTPPASPPGAPTPPPSPHGGASIQTFIARITTWLETLEPTQTNQRIVAITHASVLRAAPRRRPPCPTHYLLGHRRRPAHPPPPQPYPRPPAAPGSSAPSAR